MSASPSFRRRRQKNTVTSAVLALGLVLVDRYGTESAAGLRCVPSASVLSGAEVSCCRRRSLWGFAMGCTAMDRSSSPPPKAAPTFPRRWWRWRDSFNGFWKPRRCRVSIAWQTPRQVSSILCEPSVISLPGGVGALHLACVGTARQLGTGSA